MSFLSVILILVISLFVAPGMVLLAGWVMTRCIKQPIERKRLILFTIPLALGVMLMATLGGSFSLVQLPWLAAIDERPVERETLEGPAALSDEADREASLGETEEVYVSRSDFPNLAQLRPSQPSSQGPVLDDEANDETALGPTERAWSSVAEEATEPAPLIDESSSNEMLGSLSSNAKGNWTTRDATGYGLAVIIGIGLILASRMAIGIAWLHRSLRDASPASRSTMKILNDLFPPVTRKLPRVTRKVRVFASDHAKVPFAFGLLRPTIVIPKHLDNENQEQHLKMALAHELAHISQHDLWYWNLINLFQALLWHHPLYWKLRNELRVCQDQLADVWTVQRGCDEVDYAEMLLKLAQGRNKASYCVALCMSDRRTNLTRRIRMLALEFTTIRTACRRTVWLSVGVLFAVAMMFGSFRLVHAEPATHTEPESSLGDSLQDDAAAEQDSDQDEKEQDQPMNVPEWQGQELQYGGTIVDKRTGKPIEGAKVRIIRSVSSSAERRSLRTTEHTTDEEGRYEFTVPPEESKERALYIELEAEHPDYAAIGPMGYAMSMIRKNETLGERPFFEHRELEPAEPVTGKIVDSDGKPVAGCQLLGYSKLDVADFREYGSFTRTKTNEDGTFSLNLIKDGQGVFWILPEEHAIQRMVMDDKKGDVGEIKLSPGVRSSGQVLDARGNPVPNVFVSLSGSFEDQASSPILQRVAGSNDRGALTDEEGRFEFKPVAPGEYTLNISEYNQEPTVRSRETRDVPGVFVAQTVTLTDGPNAEPFQLQAVPHVLFTAQYYDGKGEKCRGHEVMLFGQMDGQFVRANAKPDKEGTAVALLPHGVEQLQVMLMTNEHGSLRYRMSADEELKPAPIGGQVMYDRVEEDIEGFEIVRYKAPIVLLEAVDEDGKQIEGFVVWAAYPWGDQRYILDGGRNSDLSFEKQQDGRYRTSQMLPDEDVTFHIEADGYVSHEEVVNLKEGAEKTVRVTLKKSDDQPEMAKSTTHQGTVLDRTTDQPVANATVTLTRSLVHKSGEGLARRDEVLEVTTHKTNEEGDFEFSLSDEIVSDEDVVLWFVVNADGYAESPRAGVRASKVEGVDASELAFQQLKVSPSRKVVGRVLDPEGNPISDAALRVTCVIEGTFDTLGYYEGQTDDSGAFQFDVARESAVAIDVYSDEFALFASVLKPDQSDFGDLVLLEGVSLHGEVVDARGNPTPNVAIALMGDHFPKNWPFPEGVASPYYRSVRTDDKGQYRFPPLPEGEYTLNIGERNIDPVSGDQLLPRLDATFVQKSIELSRELASSTYQIQAVPHIEVTMSFVDLNGESVEKTPSRVSLWGQLNGELFSTPFLTKVEQTMTVRAPHGLTGAAIQLNYSENDYIFGIRDSSDGSIHWQHPCQLGDLIEDIDSIEIAVARMASLELEVVDKEGNAIDGVSADNLTRVSPGKYKWERLVPGYEFNRELRAEGMKAHLVEFTLADGEHKSMKVVMERESR